MPFKEVRSIRIVGLCFRKILSRRIFIALFIIISTCQFSSSVIAESIHCQCGNTISKIQTVLVYTDLGEKKYCCPHCGFSALKLAKEQVKEVRVGDYSTGKLINAKEARFAEGYFTESPCCNGSWIPFEKHADARKFIFKSGGRILDFQGKMILERKPVPPQNNVWIYIGSAVIFLAIYFAFIKKSQEKGTKSRKIIKSTLVFIITLSLITALAVVWKPKNFDHRVLRLTLDEDGNHTVVGELQEIVLKQSGSEGKYDLCLLQLQCHSRDIWPCKP